MAEIQRVPATGEVLIVPRLIRQQPIVGAVVDATKAEGGAEVIALRGMVVDDIENDLDAGVVQPRYCGAKGVERIFQGVARVGSEEANAVVAPVVAQPALDQMPIIDEGVDRKELDCGDAESLEVIDYGLRRETAERAAPGGRHILTLLGEALDLGFVHDCVFPTDCRVALFTPGEGFIDDHRLRHSARVVAPVEREVRAGAAGAIAEMRIAPDQTAHDPFGIRIDEQLVMIEAQPPPGVVAAVNAIAIELARRNIVEIAVPDVLGALGQKNALDLASPLPVKQAQLDLLGVRREQRKIGAASVPRGAERMRSSGRKPQS